MNCDLSGVFLEQFLRHAASHACYNDNSSASKDAECILWACRKIAECTRLGDLQYANFLQVNLRKGYK